MRLIGLIGKPRGPWPERLALLSQMLVLSTTDGIQATGFFARSAPYQSHRRPRLIGDRALLPPNAFVTGSHRWRSLHRCGVVVAYTQPLPSGVDVDTLPQHIPSDQRWAVIEDGLMPAIASYHSGHLFHRSTGTNKSALLNHGENVGDITTALMDILDRSSAPLTAVVLDQVMEQVHVGRIGRPLCLCRLQGEGCWFLCPSSDLLEEALRRVIGPQSPRVEAAIPVADASLLTLLFDGTVFLNTTYSSQAGNTQFPERRGS